MTAPEKPGPAPELKAAMEETRAYRDILAEVLGSFEEDPWGSGMRIARVPERKVRQWRDRSGIREGR